MEAWVYLVLLGVSLAHMSILVYMVVGPVTMLNPPEGSFLVVLLILLDLTTHALIIAANGGSWPVMTGVLLVQIILSILCVHHSRWIASKVNGFLPFDRE